MHAVESILGQFVIFSLVSGAGSMVFVRMVLQLGLCMVTLVRLSRLM